MSESTKTFRRGTSGHSRFRSVASRASLSPAVESSREVRRRTSMEETQHRQSRTLQPLPAFRKPDPRSSVKAFLLPSALPAGCRPESVDVAFKSPLALLRRLTLDAFEAQHRYMFIFKPLAKVNIVLSNALLDVPGGDLASSTESPMTPELRAAIMYVACNSFRSVYGMAYAGQMKSVYKANPPGLQVMGKMIIAGLGFSEEENNALDFAQQLSLLPASELGGACRASLTRAGNSPADMKRDRAALLERQVAGVVSYAAFMCRAYGALDVDLSYDAVKYAASTSSNGLHWNSAGRHFNFDAGDEMEGHVGTSNKEKPSPAKREGRAHKRRLPNLISSSVTVPRLLADVVRVRETWLQTALVPKGGALLEMNDCIASWFGFTPFYLSVSVVLGEEQRRALLFGCKELLFSEGELSRRLKFIVCYVSSLHIGGGGNRKSDPVPGMQRRSSEIGGKDGKGGLNGSFMMRRRSARPTSVLSTIDEEMETVEEEEELTIAIPKFDDRPAEKDENLSRPRENSTARGSSGQFERRGSTPRQGAKCTASDGDVYDGAGIIQAHAAFLACKYGATAAELTAVADEKSVVEAMERYLAQAEDDTDLVAFPVGFPLTKKDCAAVLLAYSLAKSPPDISAARLQFIESSFGKSPFAHRARGGRNCHQAALEIIGATSMWGLLERYCAGAVTFDVDYSANLYFGEGEGCEPEIASFCRSPAGKKIGLAQNYKRFKQGKSWRKEVGSETSDEPAPVMLDRHSSGYRNHKKPLELEPDHLGSRSSGGKRSVSFLSNAGSRVGRIMARSSGGGKKIKPWRPESTS